jgi:hypothetical protein
MAKLPFQMAKLPFQIACVQPLLSTKRTRERL